MPTGLLNRLMRLISTDLFCSEQSLFSRAFRRSSNSGGFCMSLLRLRLREIEPSEVAEQLKGSPIVGCCCLLWS